MCSIIISRKPNHPWPLAIAANRDEMAGRPWRALGRHWPAYPEVTAGLDEEAGGSWLGFNDSKVLASVLNRFGTLGSMPGKRSRGELVLEALSHDSACESANALNCLDPSSYRPFNLVIADLEQAFWLKNDGMSISTLPIPPGISMLTAYDLNDFPNCPRIHEFLPRFQKLEHFHPGNWNKAWELLRSPTPADKAAIFFPNPHGFGTLSSNLIALSAREVRVR